MAKKDCGVNTPRKFVVTLDFKWVETDGVHYCTIGELAVGTIHFESHDAHIQTWPHMIRTPIRNLADIHELKSTVETCVLGSFVRMGAIEMQRVTDLSFKSGVISLN